MLNMSPDYASAVEVLAVSTSAAVIIGSWIGHIHYKQMALLRHERDMAQIKVEEREIEEQMVNGPSPDDVIDRAKAEERLAKAIERRQAAEEKDKQTT